MGNRVAALSAALHLATTQFAAGESAMLQSELDLLERLLVQLRELSGDSTQSEALIAVDSAHAAAALFSYHGDFRQHQIIIDNGDSVPPAKAVPVALLRALLVALSAACKAAASGGGSKVTMSLRHDDDVVRFTATSGAEDAAVGGPRYTLEADTINWLLESSGGRGIALPNGCIVEVPTLAASRRYG